MATTITLPMTHLVQLVRFAGHAASDEKWGLPALSCIQFTAGPGEDHLPHYEHRTFSEHRVKAPLLTAAATDRFRLAWASAGCKVEGDPATFMVTAVALRSMVRGLPAQGSGRNKRSYDVTITLLERGAARFTVSDEATGYEQSTTLATVPGDFPKIGKVLRFGNEQAKPDCYAVNPVYAAQMFDAFRHIRPYRGVPIAVSHTGDNLPVRFSMVNDTEVRASGMLMPMKEG
jgi:hypothetical protein